MSAISDGELSDVIAILNAGGNPNDFIKESGESPLSYAMHRACDRKDISIIEHILSLDLMPETVNRESSTKRSTPLKFAIEMANVKAVKRLIDLGANIEVRCDYTPSALCYAMSLFFTSVNPNDTLREQAYFLGEVPADVHDAKDGAAFDLDLAERRQHYLNLLNSSDRNKGIYKAVQDYYLRPASDYRAVIFELLRNKANPNCLYKIRPSDTAIWTPTLFAAQVGDLDLFKTLIKYGGNPYLKLMESSPLESYDALWVANDHQNYSIIKYLTEDQIT